MEEIRKSIIEMLDKIENTDRLIKILAIVQTHYEMSKEKGEV